MQNAKRELEIKEEMARLKAELKSLSGEPQLELKNRRLVECPFVMGNPVCKPEAFPSNLHSEEISSVVRKVLAPTGEKDKNGRFSLKMKKVKDLTREEYNAVCKCTDKMLEILHEYNVMLHPNGIYKGAYVEGMELYL